MRAHRHDALLAALAQHTDQALIEIQISPAQAADFGQAQSGGIEQLQQGAVTQAQWRIGGQFHQLHSFIHVQHLRQCARGFGCTHAGAGIRCNAALFE